MNAKKYKLALTIIIGFIGVSFTTTVYGGSVTTTPPPVDAIQDVVVAPDGNVTFNASSNQGTVTIDQSFSSFDHGTPSYSGSGSTAIVVVTFTDDATGNDNSCTVVVNHTVPSLSGGGTQQCANEQPITFNVIVPKVTFASLSAIKVNGPYGYHEGPPVSTERLASTCKTDGTVTVAPKSAVEYVDLQLVQWINSRLSQPGLSPSAIPYSGVDSNYTTAPATQQGDNTLEVQYTDDPGVTYNKTQLISMSGNTVTNDLSANDYMQWRVHGSSSSWITVGKVSWGTHPTMAITYDDPTLSFDIEGALNPGTGATSTENPTAPSSYSSP